ncbi:MAG: hypothetical protein ACREOO_32440 [bacterium]
MSEIQAEYLRFTRKPLFIAGAVIALVLVAEVAFNIVERAIGHYLVWQNSGRPKIGRTWQEGENRLAAHTKVEEITRTMRERVRALSGITTFDELIAFLSVNPSITLSPEQFGIVYQSLPEFFRPLVVPAEELMKIPRAQGLAEVLVERRQDKLEIVLITPGQQVAYRSELSSEQVAMLGNHGREVVLDLRIAERFKEHMLTGAEFFEILDRLFIDDRTRMIRELPVLTDLGATIARVAISQEVTAGFVETAFALDDARARIYYLPEQWTIPFAAHTRAYESPSHF